MATLLGRVISKSVLGHASLRVNGEATVRDHGQRVEVLLDDDTRAHLSIDPYLVIEPLERHEGTWDDISKLPLGQLFADVGHYDELPVELEGWLLAEGTRIAIDGVVEDRRIVTSNVVIFAAGETDDSAIARLAGITRAKVTSDAEVMAEVDAVLEEGAERHIEMTWTCATCKNKNLGRFKKCQGCGKPKEAEEYEMPEHPETAASVTDAGLLRMAKAGADWRCAYCGSDQRAIDGNCGQCGASASTAVPEPQPLVEPPAPRTWIKWVIAGGAAVVVLVGLLIWNAKRAHNYDGTVTAVAWSQVIEVEHYANHDHEGFQENIPTGATEVTSVGQKVHHQEQVLDHMETEHYTEEVPDGFRSESYSEQVSCGQDCTESPKSCHQECTSKKNGFASCHQVCSGGGRSCTTKYCSQSRTRQVPKTRTESRSREVPRYRSEPRYAEAFHYKAWDWTKDRTVHAEGTEATGIHWPDNGAKVEGLPDHEQERETRHGTYGVTLRYHGDDTVHFAVTTPEALAPFTTKSEHAVKRVEKQLFVDGKPITPL